MSGINASIRTALNPSSLGHLLPGATAGQRVALLPPPPKCHLMGGSKGDGLNLAWGLSVLVVSVFPCIEAGRALACPREPWVRLGLLCTWALYSEAHSNSVGWSDAGQGFMSLVIILFFFPQSTGGLQ